MKKFGYIALVFLLIAFTAGALSAAEITCFGELFQRQIGQPRHESHTFNALANQATVKVYNGDGDHWLKRAVAAKVKINGEKVFRPRDFKKRVAYIEAQVDLLEGENSLEIILLGMPGVKFRLEIVQEAEEAEIILADQNWAADVCRDKIEQIGDSDEARVEAVALIKNLPGVIDAGISLDGSVWIDYDSGLSGVILLGPEGTQGGWSSYDGGSGAVVESNSGVLIWDPFLLAPIANLVNIFNMSDCPENPTVKIGPTCDVESIKDFSEYGTIIIDSHGAYLRETPILVTGEVAFGEPYDEHPVYKSDVIVTPPNEGVSFWGIKPGYISTVLEDSLKNAVVMNASCHLFKNDDFANAFVKTGKANTYFGFTNTTKTTDINSTLIDLFTELIINNKNTIEAFESLETHCFETLKDTNGDWLPGGYVIIESCIDIYGEEEFKYSCGNPGLITIDGDPADWDGIKPIVEDSDGNAPDDYADFRKLFITHDDINIYFLAEFYDDLEVTEYPDTPFDLGIDYADLNIYLDTDLDNNNHCDGIEFGFNITNMWHPAYNDYGWLEDFQDCGGTSADFPEAVSTAINGRYIESSVSRAELETLTPNMRGFDLKLASPLWTNIARYWLDGTDKPGPVFVDPTGGLWHTSPQIIKVSSSNAERIYCTLRTSTDGSIPSDPPIPTIESHDPFDVGVDYISGSAGDFVFWESNNGIKNLKVRFRAYNENGYGPTSDVYFYRIDFPPTIAQTPMSGPPGTTFVQWGTGFTPNSAARLHFRKPDGSEYPPVYVNLDEIGHFEVEYMAPLDKPSGEYTWWAIDLSTDEWSNPVSYWID